MIQASEPEKDKPLYRCTDAEILRELWRRKRMVELHATETLDDEMISRYRNEEGFWRDLRRGIFRKLGAAIEERRDSIVHQSSAPAKTYFRSTEYRKSVWLITRPTGGAIE